MTDKNDCSYCWNKWDSCHDDRGFCKSVDQFISVDINKSDSVAVMKKTF